VFTVTGAGPCTATETVPTGYTANQASCVDVALNGTCTITNTLASNAIAVYKDFLPNDPATVSVALTCSGGGVPTASPLNASEGSPAVFTVAGAGPCTATEIVPDGYTAVQTGCEDVALGDTCTIFNTLIPPPANLNIPTLSEWGMIGLVALLALTGLAAIRRLGA
jgi:hypothetical protein